MTLKVEMSDEVAFAARQAIFREWHRCKSLSESRSMKASTRREFRGKARMLREALDAMLAENWKGGERDGSKR